MFLDTVEKELNKNLHGQVNAKKAILRVVGELIANPKADAKPLLFIGPPGTGKTSLAKAIASALDRYMGFIGLGGADRHELKGSDIVYESPSMGSIAAILQKAGHMNPVIVLDEVDKIGTGRDGQTLNAQLMQLLDPSVEWDDQYIRLKMDTNPIWFILTANYLDQIDRVLLDRVTVINVGAQTRAEKKVIAQEFMIPKLCKTFNIPKEVFHLSDELVMSIIDHMPYEQGCRKLYEVLQNMMSNINLHRLKTEVAFPTLDEPVFPDPSAFRLPYTITQEDVTAVTQAFHIDQESIHLHPKVGMINGMYATQSGLGGILPIQVLYSEHIAQDTYTGKLGSVMQESILVAKTINATQSLFPISNAISISCITPKAPKKNIHLHTPDMAIGKDGPSAGAAITLAMLSAIHNKPIKHTIAVTGEIDLFGSIGPVGGIYEKLSGAKRAGVTHAFIPRKNNPLLQEAIKKDPQLLDGFKVSMVGHISELISQVFLSKGDVPLLKPVKVEAAVSQDSSEPTSLLSFRAEDPIKKNSRKRGFSDI